MMIAGMMSTVCVFVVAAAIGVVSVSDAAPTTAPSNSSGLWILNATMPPWLPFNHTQWATVYPNIKEDALNLSKKLSETGGVALDKMNATVWNIGGVVKQNLASVDKELEDKVDGLKLEIGNLDLTRHFGVSTNASKKVNLKTKFGNLLKLLKVDLTAPVSYHEKDAMARVDAKNLHLMSDVENHNFKTGLMKILFGN